MHRLFVVADDLSGAADCGIACVHAGVSAIVSLSTPEAHVQTDVLVLDADTRVMPENTAAAYMEQLVRKHAARASILLYQKIDSTLRGHIGFELSAVLRARRTVVSEAVAILAPAFPGAGRTTVGGIQFLHGMPLHETEMWRHAGLTGEATIEGRLRETGLRCHHLKLDVVRHGKARTTAELRAAANSADVVICDAELDCDMEAIADATASLGARAVWVGSAGLAQHLVRACGLKPAGPPPDHQLPVTEGPLLVVIGSTSQTTKQQAAVLLSSTDIHGIVVPPEILLAGRRGTDWSAFTVELMEAVERGEDVILLCGSEPEIAAELRPRLSQSLSEMTATLRGKVGALVASGGETARKVLDRWGVHTMQLHGELEKGVPISSTVVDGAKSLTVITKAGDFGQPYTLLHCREWILQTRTTR